ncbi:MAG: hypothetical protein GX333_03765 [Syntrophomonadaceae bacterium]|nr:hypothetical protein [Syntrophomonadaceae bacterium]
MRKLITLLLIVFVVSLVGCQNTAQKKIVNPNNTNNNLTESEHRVMAGKISNLATEVEGVNKASVVIARINLSDKDFIKNTDSTKVGSSGGQLDKGNKNNSSTAYPDINSDNINTVTDDNNRNMASPGGGLVVLIGINVNDSIKQDSNKLNRLINNIEEKVRSQEFMASKVYISSNPEIVGRIDTIAAGTLQGENINDYTEEIISIIESINK